MGLKLDRFNDRYWSSLRELIKTPWAERHPILNKELFDWQYRGYGPLSDGRPHVHLAIDAGAVIGFIGTIPGLYQLASSRGPLLEGRSAIAMWMVSPNYRKSGVGTQLLVHAQRVDSTITCLGVNEISGSIFLKLGYDELGKLTRWVIPLALDYEHLLPEQASSAQRSSRLRDWLGVIPQAPAAEECPPGEVTAELAQLWAAGSHSRKGKTPNGLLRNQEYYQWRYAESPCYRYRVLRAMGGAAVVRVEHADNNSQTCVLRILEILPSGPGTLFGEGVDKGLLPAVLEWARGKGCVAADYQVMGDCYSPTLEFGGFRRRSSNQPETMLAEVFRPYRPSASPINVYCRPAHEIVGNWCFVKSDGDMDRPNELIDERT